MEGCPVVGYSMREATPLDAPRVARLRTEVICAASQARRIGSLPICGKLIIGVRNSLGGLDESELRRERRQYIAHTGAIREPYGRDKPA